MVPTKLYAVIHSSLAIPPVKQVSPPQIAVQHVAEECPPLALVVGMRERATVSHFVAVTFVDEKLAHFTDPTCMLLSAPRTQRRYAGGWRRCRVSLKRRTALLPQPSNAQVACAILWVIWFGLFCDTIQSIEQRLLVNLPVVAALPAFKDFYPRIQS